MQKGQKQIMKQFNYKLEAYKLLITFVCLLGVGAIIDGILYAFGFEESTMGDLANFIIIFVTCAISFWLAERLCDRISKRMERKRPTIREIGNEN